MKVAELIELLKKFDGYDKVLINDTNGTEWVIVQVHNNCPYQRDVVWLEVE